MFTNNNANSSATAIDISSEQRTYEVLYTLLNKLKLDEPFYAEDDASDVDRAPVAFNHNTHLSRLGSGGGGGALSPYRMPSSDSLSPSNSFGGSGSWGTDVLAADSCFSLGASAVVGGGHHVQHLQLSPRSANAAGKTAHQQQPVSTPAVVSSGLLGELNAIVNNSSVNNIKTLPAQTMILIEIFSLKPAPAASSNSSNSSSSAKQQQQQQELLLQHRRDQPLDFAQRGAMDAMLLLLRNVAQRMAGPPTAAAVASSSSSSSSSSTYKNTAAVVGAPRPTSAAAVAAAGTATSNQFHASFSKRNVHLYFAIICSLCVHCNRTAELVPLFACEEFLVSVLQLHTRRQEADRASARAKHLREVQQASMSALASGKSNNKLSTSGGSSGGSVIALNNSINNSNNSNNNNIAFAHAPPISTQRCFTLEYDEFKRRARHFFGPQRDEQVLFTLRDAFCIEFLLDCVLPPAVCSARFEALQALLWERKSRFCPNLPGVRGSLAALVRGGSMSHINCLMILGLYVQAKPRFRFLERLLAEGLMSRLLSALKCEPPQLLVTTSVAGNASSPQAAVVAGRSGGVTPPATIAGKNFGGVDNALFPAALFLPAPLSSATTTGVSTALSSSKQQRAASAAAASSTGGANNNISSNASLIVHHSASFSLFKMLSNMSASEWRFRDLTAALEFLVLMATPAPADESTNNAAVVMELMPEPRKSNSAAAAASQGRTSTNSNASPINQSSVPTPAGKGAAPSSFSSSSSSVSFSQQQQQQQNVNKTNNGTNSNGSNNSSDPSAEVDQVLQRLMMPEQHNGFMPWCYSEVINDIVDVTFVIIEKPKRALSVILRPGAATATAFGAAAATEDSAVATKRTASASSRRGGGGGGGGIQKKNTAAATSVGAAVPTPVTLPRCAVETLGALASSFVVQALKFRASILGAVLTKVDDCFDQLVCDCIPELLPIVVAIIDVGDIIATNIAAQHFYFGSPAENAAAAAAVLSTAAPTPGKAAATPKGKRATKISDDASPQARVPVAGQQQQQQQQQPRPRPPAPPGYQKQSDAALDIQRQIVEDIQRYVTDWFSSLTRHVNSIIKKMPLHYTPTTTAASTTATSTQSSSSAAAAAAVASSKQKGKHATTVTTTTPSSPSDLFAAGTTTSSSSFQQLQSRRRAALQLLPHFRLWLNVLPILLRAETMNASPSSLAGGLSPLSPFSSPMCEFPSSSQQQQDVLTSPFASENVASAIEQYGLKVHTAAVLVSTPGAAGRRLASPMVQGIALAVLNAHAAWTPARGSRLSNNNSNSNTTHVEPLQQHQMNQLPLPQQQQQPQQSPTTANRATSAGKQQQPSPKTATRRKNRDDDDAESFPSFSSPQASTAGAKKNAAGGKKGSNANTADNNSNPELPLSSNALLKNWSDMPGVAAANAMSPQSHLYAKTTRDLRAVASQTPMHISRSPSPRGRSNNNSNKAPSNVMNINQKNNNNDDDDDANHEYTPFSGAAGSFFTFGETDTVYETAGGSFSVASPGVSAGLGGGGGKSSSRTLLALGTATTLNLDSSSSNNSDEDDDSSSSSSTASTASSPDMTLESARRLKNKSSNNTVTVNQKTGAGNAPSPKRKPAALSAGATSTTADGGNKDKDNNNNNSNNNNTDSKKKAVSTAAAAAAAVPSPARGSATKKPAAKKESGSRRARTSSPSASGAGPGARGLTGKRNATKLLGEDDDAVSKKIFSSSSSSLSSDESNSEGISSSNSSDDMTLGSALKLKKQTTAKSVASLPATAAAGKKSPAVPAGKKSAAIASLPPPAATAPVQKKSTSNNNKKSSNTMNQQDGATLKTPSSSSGDDDEDDHDESVVPLSPQPRRSGKVIVPAPKTAAANANATTNNEDGGDNAGIFSRFSTMLVRSLSPTKRPAIVVADSSNNNNLSSPPPRPKLGGKASSTAPSPKPAPRKKSANKGKAKSRLHDDDGDDEEETSSSSSTDDGDGTDAAAGSPQQSTTAGGGVIQKWGQRLSAMFWGGTPK